MRDRLVAALPRGRQRWALLAIVGLAFVLRIHALGRGPLWFDEALSGVIATKGWQGILLQSSTTPFEHPPLYYLALHLWTALAGGSSFALRFFSLFWGVLLVPLLYRFVGAWGGRRLALLAALVAAVSVSHVEQSQNARMYTLVVFLGVLSLDFLLRALQTGRPLLWAGYLLVTGLGIGVHYYFALLLLLPVALLAQGGRRYRRLLILFVVLLLAAGLLAAGWLWFSPGPRQAVGQILRGEGGGVSSLALRARVTIGGLLLEEPAAGSVALGLLAVVGVLFWPRPSSGAPAARRQRARGVAAGAPASENRSQTRPANHFPGRQSAGSRCFVLTWLLVPWLAALAIPYYLQGRHLAYLWPALFVLAAAGLLALWARRRWLFVLGLLLVAATSAHGLYRWSQEVASRPDFGGGIAHVEDHALPGDLVVMDQPSMWPFVDYYDRRDLQVAYVPESPSYGKDAVAQRLESAVGSHSRIWLGPLSAWTADPQGLVARWLGINTFQAYKQWFPGSSSVALYFAPVPLNRLPVGRTEWENGIRLLRASSSSLAVVPGDALRLEFEWAVERPLDRSPVVSLDLVDDQGTVWASRDSEPCSSWCPADGWQPGQAVQDRHALLVPPGTPPGSYRLQVSWYLPAEGRTIAVEKNGTGVDLGSVTVGRSDRSAAGETLPSSIPNPMRARFGDQLTLVGFDLARPVVRASETFFLDLHWVALSAPDQDLVLRLELVDAGDGVVATWDRPPVAGFFPTSNWQAGDYMRALKQLALPAEVLPGKYHLRLRVLDAAGRPLPLGGTRPRRALAGLFHWDHELQGDSLDLTPLQVLEKADRPRTFDLPPISHPLSARVGGQAELLGYDLDVAAAVPGGQIGLTLYWRARGPMDRPYKVFTHLGDGLHPPVAQDDAPPGDGCCPTNTWVEGEIVVDRHRILLPDDLAGGTYRLMAGLYDEASGQRLPVSDGPAGNLDRVFIADVDVRSAPTPVPPPVRTSLPFKTYLPFVYNDW